METIDEIYARVAKLAGMSPEKLLAEAAMAQDAKDVTGEMPVFQESIVGAQIDAARICTMTAMQLVGHEPLIALPDDAPTIGDCLEEAAKWLDAARALSVQQAPAPTSIHVVTR